MKIAFIYAGQGSQKVGMGKDFYENDTQFQAVMDMASEAVSDVTAFDVKTCCFEGPIEQLSQTRYTQPCMVAFAVGVTKMLKAQGIRPEYVCGLSLGEYSALYAAEVLGEQEVLNLVAFRGKVMEEAVVDREVKMSAVLMMDRDTIAECCEVAQKQSQKVVQVANYNCPGQIVISGEAEAVDLATELLKEKGAKRVVPLNVSGPFHTSLMKLAGDQLRERFKTISFAEPKSTIVFNATGKPMAGDENFAGLLEKQVQSSVYLEDSIRYLKEQGVDTFIEIGPGNAISKFIKKTVSDVAIYSIDSLEDYKKVLEAIKE